MRGCLRIRIRDVCGSCLYVVRFRESGREAQPGLRTSTRQSLSISKAVRFAFGSAVARVMYIWSGRRFCVCAPFVACAGFGCCAFASLRRFLRSVSCTSCGIRPRNG